MKKFTLDGRLASAAKLVRQGARFADIGTDHAHLPIFLLQSGIIEYAVCSDINEGPLKSARENARVAGVSEKIDFTLADGAGALEKKNVTDIAICGIGGELIAYIIENAPFLRRLGIRLILQPMSRIGALREKLAMLGFSVNAEEYSESAGKLYVTLAADYDGITREISEYEAEFGNEKFLTDISGAKRAFFIKKAAALSRAASGKAEGGKLHTSEEKLYNYVKELLGR